MGTIYGWEWERSGGAGRERDGDGDGEREGEGEERVAVGASDRVREGEKGKSGGQRRELGGQVAEEEGCGAGENRGQGQGKGVRRLRGLGSQQIEKCRDEGHVFRLGGGRCAKWVGIYWRASRVRG